MKTQEPGPLEDDAREPMLYDPEAPARGGLLDHLPGAPRITAAGALAARPGFVLHLLIAPAAFVGFTVETVIRMI